MLKKWVAVAAAAVLLGAAAPQPSSVTLAGAAAAAGPELKVNALQGRHAISPDIYGINNYAVDHAIYNDVAIPVERRGGNHTSHYNWLMDSGNAGSDYFFMGGKGVPADEVVPGKEVDDMVSLNGRYGAKSVVTIPLTGYVNKFSHWNCSYPESLYPKQGLQWWTYEFNPWARWTENPPGGSEAYPNGERCGSGLDPERWQEGKQLDNINPLLNYEHVDSDWMRGWIEHLVGKHGTAAGGGVEIYQMDNEPESWSHVHHDVHPDGAGFDEVVDKTLDYGAMIKGVDPAAAILGPSNWGVPAYYDMNKPGDDAASHGGTPWYAYYLTRMKAFEQQNGYRLLDYYDQHFYPSVDGHQLANVGDNGSASTREARLRSTRALWDPTYNQENWMGTWFPDTYGKIALVPRLRQWVDTYYPGTKTAITEYNWGALDSINGALAQADILGIFGREGLDLATLWGPPKADQPGAFAFRMYLNYDGSGSRYGDTWVESESADQEKLAVYGAQRTSDGALTLMVVNKSGADLTSNLTVEGFMPNKQQAQVYRYSEANLAAIEQLPDAVISKVNGKGHTGVPDSRIQYAFPANSITLFVIPGSLVPGAQHEPGSGKPGAGLQQLK